MIAGWVSWSEPRNCSWLDLAQIVVYSCPWRDSRSFCDGAERETCQRQGMFSFEIYFE
jgi:hypothetical protein